MLSPPHSKGCLNLAAPTSKAEYFWIAGSSLSLLLLSSLTSAQQLNCSFWFVGKPRKHLCLAGPSAHRGAHGLCAFPGALLVSGQLEAHGHCALSSCSSSARCHCSVWHVAFGSQGPGYLDSKSATESLSEKSLSFKIKRYLKRYLFILKLYFITIPNAA